MPRGQKLSALFVIVAAVAAMIYTVAAGNSPLLGLDLQGGVSVVLQPTEPADDRALDQSVDILRSRVDALGVAEPEIARQGDTIVVDLPGVEQQQRALELVGQTAELRFRPVLFDLGPVGGLADAATGTDGSTDDTGTTDGTGSTDDTGSGTTDGTGTTSGSDNSTTSGPTGGGSTEEQSLARVNGRLGAATPSQSASTTTAPGDASTTTAPDVASTTTAPGDSSATDTGGDTSATTVPGEPAAIDPTQQAIVDACGTGEPTPPEQDAADGYALLVDEENRMLCLGPTLLTGEALESAKAILEPSGGWTVNPVFRSGADGIDLFNQAALECYGGNPVVCPAGPTGQGRLAIVLDHKVMSSPTIQSASFTRDQITISGEFDEQSAKDLEAVLRFGALPVELETQQVQTVSATIGSDVLRAGLIAGAIGLGLVALYLLLYYRLAALVTIVGLGLSAALLWSLIAWMGESLGLALTLGGVVGLIVSIGIAADSSIVYFENVKELHQSGRKLSTSVERAYKVAISTIVKAGFVSLIAAGLLYWLTVGAVRGFAFYLGLATLFDLLIAWLFMRPALTFLVRRKGLSERADRVLGVHRSEVTP